MKAKNFEEEIVFSIAFLLIAVAGMFLIMQADANLYTQITGKATTMGTTVNITPAPPFVCSFALEQGISLVSFHCIGDFEEPQAVFENLTSLTGVFGYAKGDADSWKAYNPNVPSWVVQDLTSVSKLEGYWVRMNASEVFSFTGILSFPAGIPITAGYNLVGYPSNISKNIAISLQSIDGNYSKVVGFLPSTGAQEFIPGSGGLLTDTTPNRGYWINGTTSDNWVISS